MNKLFIIGNGFDLAHGLKTSYSDFILWLHKDLVRLTFEKSKNGNYNFVIPEYPQKYFSVNINTNGLNVNQIDNLIVHLNTIDKLNNYLSSIMNDMQNKPILRFTYSTEFFKRIIKENQIKNWVDLENEYYTAIKNVYINFERSNNLLFTDYEPSIIEINNIFSFLKDRLKDYLLQLDYNSTVVESINKIFNSQFHLNKSIKYKPGIFMFLNFNYTNTLNRYLNSEFIERINHIHGYIENDEPNIIFGYGDEIDKYYEKLEHLNNNHLLEHFKSFGYFQNSNYRELLAFLEDRFEVIIMGHSCGLSDRVLLNTIFEHNNCESIRIYYHLRDNNTNDYILKTKEISRHFKDKASMRKKIVSYDLSEPLVYTEQTIRNN